MKKNFTLNKFLCERKGRVAVKSQLWQRYCITHDTFGEYMHNFDRVLEVRDGEIVE